MHLPSEKCRRRARAVMIPLATVEIPPVTSAVGRQLAFIDAIQTLIMRARVFMIDYRLPCDGLGSVLPPPRATRPKPKTALVAVGRWRTHHMHRPPGHQRFGGKTVFAERWWRHCRISAALSSPQQRRGADDDDCRSRRARRAQTEEAAGMLAVSIAYQQHTARQPPTSLAFAEILPMIDAFAISRRQPCMIGRRFPRHVQRYEDTRG